MKVNPFIGLFCYVICTQFYIFYVKFIYMSPYVTLGVLGMLILGTELFDIQGALDFLKIVRFFSGAKK